MTQLLGEDCIDDLVDEFEGKFGQIGIEERAKYVSLLKKRSKDFTDKRAMRDYVLLFGYVMGERDIFDEVGNPHRITDISDLEFLSYSNVNNINDLSEKRRNPELYDLFRGIVHRKSNHNCPNYGETLNQLFAEAEVIEHLGSKADYRLDVCQISSESGEYDMLKDYVLGRKKITDASGKKERINGIDDLTLLCTKNVTSKDSSKGWRNPELHDLFGRIHHRNERAGAPDYGEILNKIFAEAEVIEHLGSEAKYDRDVCQIQLELGDYLLLRDLLFAIMIES